MRFGMCMGAGRVYQFINANNLKNIAITINYFQ